MAAGSDEEAADRLEELAPSVYPCDECHMLEAPSNISPLSEKEGCYITSCEACGGWFHHMCGYDLPTRKYLLQQCAGDGAPQHRVICKACCVQWTQDPYNLNHAAKACIRMYKASLQKTCKHAMSTLSCARGLPSGGCLPVGAGATGGAHLRIRLHA